MSFETLSIITAIAASLLGLGWLTAGKLMIRRWGGEPSDMALVIGRRIGAVYLSLGLLFFLVHSTKSTELITALSIVGLSANALLAILGLFEFLMRRINASIFVSIAVELLLAIGFAGILLD
jgi:hypothetical protein